jgi:hypothetical protein
MPKPNLTVVPAIRRAEPAPPELILRHAIPALREAEALVRTLRQRVSEQGRLLAKKRGVGFIREEQLKQEFGNGDRS